ncbi:hypothetical protein [Frigidibacter sp. MR17.24]|uniref:hypothetical protein n=1 Tax=Frigidibacter sp. MR17.24 TaxID=3127345 RepID=UPI003012DD6F
MAPPANAPPVNAAPANAAPPVPPALATLAATCRRQGGSFAPRRPGSSLWTCFTRPRDAGRSCRKASDCSTACLAANRTCAPVAPLLGCHPVLTDRGEAVTQCIE